MQKKDVKHHLSSGVINSRRLEMERILEEANLKVLLLLASVSAHRIKSQDSARQEKHMEAISRAIEHIQTAVPLIFVEKGKIWQVQLLPPKQK